MFSMGMAGSEKSRELALWCRLMPHVCTVLPHPCCSLQRLGRVEETRVLSCFSAADDFRTRVYGGSSSHLPALCSTKGALQECWMYMHRQDVHQTLLMANSQGCDLPRQNHDHECAAASVGSTSQPAGKRWKRCHRTGPGHSVISTVPSKDLK